MARTRGTRKRSTSKARTQRTGTGRARGANPFVCEDCGFVARHAMGLGRHRSARHGAVSKRSARKPRVRALEGWLTRTQAADHAGVHYNTIRLWEQAGLIRKRQREGVRGSLLSVEDLDKVVSGRGGATKAPSTGESGAVASLERRFEQLLDGLQQLVVSARAQSTPAPRRRGRPLGSKNRPREQGTETATQTPTRRGRKPSGRARKASGQPRKQAGRPRKTSGQGPKRVGRPRKTSGQDRKQATRTAVGRARKQPGRPRKTTGRSTARTRAGGRARRRG